MTKRTCLIVVLTFCWLVAGGNQIAAGQSSTSDDGAAAYSSIAPPFVTPGKNLFVTREGDPFVVVVTATCLLEDDSDAQFELLSGPDFVHVSGGYRKESRTIGVAEGLGAIYIAPQIGDAGKYLVSLQVKACTGKVERVITFTVKVKQARLD
jgi:hypothetical protein